MTEFPRTEVGGCSLSRMIIGTNWLLGYSHTSAAKDKFIRDFQTRKNMADIIEVFLRSGVDAIMGMPVQELRDAVADAEDRVGRKVTYIGTPGFDLTPDAPKEAQAEYVFDEAKELGVTICMPHQGVTDALMDRMQGKIRDIDKYTAMIRERGMIPGLSTHMPETVVYADNNNVDVETYIQMFNAAGFLMQLEADWVMRIIKNARKPVMTIKPLAAGRLLPPVGLGFVWNAIRDQDMVTVGTMTPDEAREVIDISMEFLSNRLPDNKLQTTRSKRSLDMG